MPAPEDKRPSLAGPPAPSEEIDIAELYARLRREIRRTGAVERDGGRAGARAGVRGFAERYWAVTAEHPLERRPGLKGRLGYTVKKLLRPLLRWYVEPLAYDQRMFNDATLKLLDALWEEADAMRAANAELRHALDERADELTASDFALSERIDEQARVADERARTVRDTKRTVGELEERLTRAERRTTGDAPRTVAPQPKADAFPDYFAFEAKMRGRTESVRERQAVYVDDFRAAAPVLDVGCGRGELLALLRDAAVD